MATRGRGNKGPSKAIDPIFYIPEGVEDLFYIEEVRTRLSDEEGGDELEEDGPIGDGGEEPKGNNGNSNGGGQGKPGNPDIIKIHKQTLRTKRDGSQVVDIVVVISAKNKADGYKFRVTKVASGKSNVYRVDEDGNIVEEIDN